MKQYAKIFLVVLFILVFATIGLAEESKDEVIGCTSREKVGELVAGSIELVNGNTAEATALLKDAFSKESADWCEKFGSGYKIAHIPTGRYFGATVKDHSFSIAQVLIYNGKESLVLWVVREFYPEYFEEKISDPSITQGKGYQY